MLSYPTWRWLSYGNIHVWSLIQMLILFSFGPLFCSVLLEQNNQDTQTHMLHLFINPLSPSPNHHHHHQANMRQPALRQRYTATTWHTAAAPAVPWTRWTTPARSTWQPWMAVGVQWAPTWMTKVNVWTAPAVPATTRRTSSMLGRLSPKMVSHGMQALNLGSRVLLCYREHPRKPICTSGRSFQKGI